MISLRTLLFFLTAVIASTASAESVVQKIVPVPPKTDAGGRVPSPDERTKIVRAFVAREPQISRFGNAFPDTRAEIYFEDRKAGKVRFDTSVEADGGAYLVVLSFRLQLDQALSKVTDHQCLLFGAQSVPPDLTHVSQIGPLVTFPAEDLAVFCQAPVDYLKKRVPQAKPR